MDRKFFVLILFLFSSFLKANEKIKNYWWTSGADWKMDPILMKAYWIWNDKDMLSDLDRSKEFVFTKEIYLDNNVKKADILISAQGKYTLFINEKEVGTDDNVITLEQYDIKPFLKKGNNKFEIRAKSDTWFSGLFLCGTIELINRKKIEIISDKTWNIREIEKTESKPAEELVRGVNGGFWNNVGRIMVMPEEWYRLNTKLKTPGIPWAKPYGGKKVKVLAIIPRGKQRDIVELIHRSDFEITTVFSDGYKWKKGQIAPFFPNIKGMSPEEIKNELKKSLKSSYDVIIFGGIQINGDAEDRIKCMEDIFYGTLAEPIKSMVSKGTGLIYIEGTIPPKTSSDKKEKDVSFEKELTANPVNSIPDFLIKEVPFSNLPVKFPAKLYSYGKGRIVQLSRNFSTGYGLLANPSDNNDLHYEYYISFAIKTILWAGSKEPEIRFKKFPEFFLINQDNKEPENFSFILSNVPSGSEVIFTIRLPEKNFLLPEKPLTTNGIERGQWVVRPVYEKKQKLSSGKEVFVNLKIPQLPAGKYFLDAVITKNGKKITWATTSLIIESKISIKEINLSKNVIDIADGKTDEIQADIILTEPAPANTSLSVSLIDNYDRILEEKDIKLNIGDKTTKVIFPIKSFYTTLGKVRVELLIDKKPVDIKLARFTTIRRDWDKFTFFGWTAGPTGHIGNIYLRVLGEIGLDASRHAQIDFNWLEARDIVSLPGYPAFPRYGAEKIEHEKLIKEYVEKAKKIAESQIPFDPIAFNNGDEFYYRRNENQPSRIIGFRKFLKEKYQNIGTLNRVWDASYNSFDEIKPLWGKTEEEEYLKKAHTTRNYSRIIDQWLDNYRAYNETAIVSKNAIKQIYPYARVGVDCPMWPDATSGHDWYTFMQEFDYFAPYGRGGEVIPEKQARSYKRPGQFIGLEYGGYLYMAFNRKEELTDTGWHKWRLWNGFLNGFTSIWWYQLTPPGLECNIGPGFEPYPTLKIATDEIDKIRNGYYDLFKKLKRDYGKVAIHDSIISRLAGNFLPLEFASGNFGHNMNTHVLMHILETICGYQYTFVSDQQIASGELEKYKVLFLPCSFAIGENVGKKIRKFIEEGGIVIADIRPGILDGNGKWDESQNIPKLFGISYNKSLGRKLVKGIIEGEIFGKKIKIIPEQVFPVDPSLKLETGKPLCMIDGIPLIITNEIGKGKTICLNIPFTYYRGFNMPDSLYAYWGDENHNKLISSIINELFEILGIERVVNISIPESKENWIFGLEIAYFNDGETEYIGVTKRRKDDEEKPVKILLYGKREGFVYDMFTGEFIGKTNNWNVIVNPVDVKLFSILPYKVDGIDIIFDKNEIKRGGEIKGKIKILCNSKPIRHIINIKVIRPDGKLVSYLQKNLETKNGFAEFSLSISLNEPEGEWKLIFTDVATRISKTEKILIKN